MNCLLVGTFRGAAIGTMPLTGRFIQRATLTGPHGVVQPECYFIVSVGS